MASHSSSECGDPSDPGNSSPLPESDDSNTTATTSAGREIILLDDDNGPKVWYDFDLFHQEGVDWLPPGRNLSHDFLAITIEDGLHDGVQESMTKAFPRSPTTGLGILDLLPHELQDIIITQIDLQSLFKFRQTSRSARKAVDAVRQYRIATAHGLKCVRALLHTGFAHCVTLLDFYKTLCSQRCESCHRFGEFIFFPTWTRVCLVCMSTKRQFMIVTRSDVMDQVEGFGITEIERDDLPFFTAPAGEYGMSQGLRSNAFLSEGRLLDSPRRLVPIAWLDSSVQKLSTEMSFDSPYYFGLQFALNCMGSCVLGYYNERTGKFQQGVPCAGCHADYPRTELQLSMLVEFGSEEKLLEHFK